MDSVVTSIVQTIAQAIHPDKIILFGSWSSGTARRDSDVDLAVVYSGPESNRDIRIAIHKLFEHPNFSLDLVVMRPEQFEALKPIPNTLAREIAEKGMVCYG